MANPAQETDSLAHRRNAARVAQDEAELKALLEGDTPEEEEELEAATDEEVEQPDPIEIKTEEKSEPEEKLTKEEETFKKRYGDLRRHVAEKEKAAEARIAKLEEQLNSASKNELVLPKSDADIDAWAKQYPDVAAIVEAIADKKAKERSGELDSRLKEFETIRAQTAREKAEAQLLRVHPDFLDIRSDDAFHEWAEEQPKMVQDALYDNMDDVKAVARVLDLYKADKGIKTTKTSADDKAAASSVRSRSAPAPEADETKSYLRESAVNAMSSSEYEKHHDEIQKAIREGKFIYDMKR
jgi:hypothetical protein